jgi:hypothetical protein
LEGKRVTEVHLVNYGFLYAPLNLEAADDDGSGELRTPFVKTTGCAKKTLTIPDPTRFKKPLIRINGVSASDQGYELVVALNGKEAGRLPAAQLKTPGWHEVPVERTALKAGANTIIIHAEGSPNAHPDYFSLAIDRDSAAGRSSWSEEGRRYSNEDLSGFDPGPQTGEYMIRITEWRDPAQPWPSEKLLESVKVAPAKDVAVSLKVLAGKELYCAVVSPEHGPAALEYERIGDRIKVVVPRVDIYGILLVSTQRRALDALCQGQP